MKTSVSLGKTICTVVLNQRQGGRIRQERSVWLIWSNALACLLWTSASEIRPQLGGTRIYQLILDTIWSASRDAQDLSVETSLAH